MMQVKNFMEDLVWEKVDEVIARQKTLCRCEHCRYDVVALALNFLPPRYVVSHQGEMYTKVRELEQQFNIDILSALTNAAIIVGRKPRHEQGEEWVDPHQGAKDAY